MKKYLNTNNFVTLFIGILLGSFITYAYTPSVQTMDMSEYTDMHATMNSMTAGLQNKSGRDLEKAFITEMIPHHEGAVAMAQMIISSPNADPAILKFANDIITAQSKEIDVMKVWLNTKYK